MKKARPYSIVNDPLYYGVVAFLALLATALPAALGQRWLLPIGQTLALFVLAFVGWRRGNALHVLRALVVWVMMQGLALFAIAYLLGAEGAIPNGALYGPSLLEWIFGVGVLPNSLAQSTLGRIVEMLGVPVGATISGGLLGIWFLVNSVNLYAFGLATALRATGSIWGLVAAAEPWWLLRLGAYAGLLAACALPGYTGKWSPGAWLPAERRLLYWSLGMLAVALLLELVLPTAWASFASGRIPSP